MSRDRRVALSVRVVSVVLSAGQDAVGDRLDGRGDGGHRGAELVGEVGHQPDAIQLGGLQPGGESVHGRGEIGEFGSHAGVVDAGGVVAGSEAAGGVGGGGDGGGDAAGDQDRHGGRDGSRDDDADDGGDDGRQGEAVSHMRGDGGVLGDAGLLKMTVEDAGGDDEGDDHQGSSAGENDQGHGPEDPHAQAGT